MIFCSMDENGPMRPSQHVCKCTNSLRTSASVVGFSFLTHFFLFLFIVCDTQPSPIFNLAIPFIARRDYDSCLTHPLCDVRPSAPFGMTFWAMAQKRSISWFNANAVWSATSYFSFIISVDPLDCVTVAGNNNRSTVQPYQPYIPIPARPSQPNASTSHTSVHFEARSTVRAKHQPCFVVNANNNRKPLVRIAYNKQFQPRKCGPYDHFVG